MRGRTLSLTDAEKLCAFARFCDPHGQVWNQVDATDDPHVRKNSCARSATAHRGGWWLGTMRPAVHRAEVAVSIGLVEDPAMSAAGRVVERRHSGVGADGFITRCATA